MNKPLTQGQEIAVLTSTLGHTIKERDKLRAELDTIKAALKPFADAYTASVDAHEYDINAGPPPWDFLEDWTVWMTARDAMKEDKA